MWEILEVLRRWQRGESKAAIKRETGRTRKTIRRFVDQTREVGWNGTSEPDETLAVAVARRLKPGTDEPRVGTSAAALTPHRERIRGWLFPRRAGGFGWRRCTSSWGARAWTSAQYERGSPSTCSPT